MTTAAARGGAATLALALALALAGAGPCRAQGRVAPAAAHEDTNVILLSLQCLRPDHLGAYGYARGVSPEMDALARGAVLFEHAIAQANLTPVAQMSVLTARYPRLHGMVSFDAPPEAVRGRTLQEILGYYGYATAAVLSSPEFFVRYRRQGGAPISPGSVFSRGFGAYLRPWSAGAESLRVLPTGALDWIRENRDRKFFLWIASGALHMPYGITAPESERSVFDPPGYVPFWRTAPAAAGKWAERGEPAYGVFSRVFEGVFHTDFAPRHRLTREDVDYVVGRYDAGVKHTDGFVGELLRLLESLDLDRKTLLVVHSIHGEDLGERGAFFHYDLTDAVVRQALLMRFPRGEHAGRRVAEQVRGIDIAPTILDYLGIPPSHEFQGTSLMPVIRGEGGAPPAEAFIERIPWWEFVLSRWLLEFYGASQETAFTDGERERLAEYRDRLRGAFDGLGYPPADIALRTPEWKLVVRKDPRLLEKVSWWGFITGRAPAVPAEELYDLAADPRELRNVAAQRPDVASRLRERLLAWDRAMEERRAPYGTERGQGVIPYP